VTLADNSYHADDMSACSRLRCSFSFAMDS
jgi:hypothetical protein